MQITLTTQQAQAALGLMDLAVKAGGLQVAPVAVEIANIVQAGLNAPPAAPSESPPADGQPK